MQAICARTQVNTGRSSSSFGQALRDWFSPAIDRQREIFAFRRWSYPEVDYYVIGEDACGALIGFRVGRSQRFPDDAEVLYPFTNVDEIKRWADRHGLGDVEEDQDFTPACVADCRQRSGGWVGYL